MKQFKPIVSIVAALVIVATSAMAIAQQGPPGGQGGPGQGGPAGGPQRQMRRDNSLFVVRMPTVQTHLNLTAAQKTAIEAIRPPQGGPGGGPGGPGGPGGGPGGPGGPGGGGPGGGGPGGGGQGGPGGPPPGGGQGGPGQGGQQGPPNPLAEILNQTQMSRLRQLTLQFDAPMTFLDPRAGQQLQLTQQQRQSINAAIQQHMPPPQPNQAPQTFAQMQAKKLAAYNAAWPILTATQKSAWSTMTGAAFTNWVQPPAPQH